MYTLFSRLTRVSGFSRFSHLCQISDSTQRSRPTQHPRLTRSGLTSIALILLTSITLQSCSPFGSRADVQFVFVDPLEKVLAEATFFPGQPALAEVVRGEHASLQFVVRAPANIENLQVSTSDAVQGAHRLSPSTQGFVKFVRNGRTVWDYSRDRIVSPSDYYPDPIFELASTDVPFGTAQPIWITIPIPADAQPGTYTGEVTVTGRVGGRSFSESLPYSVEVWPVTLGEGTLWVTNWFTMDAARLKWMNNGEPFEPWSEGHWNSITELARIMGEYRQNMARLPVLNMVSYSHQGEIWQFDFSRFNEVVDVFVQEGGIRIIEGGHIGGRYNEQVIGWGRAPFYVRVPNLPYDAENEFTMLPITDERARTFYRQFFTALRANLAARNLEDSYVQYIADEPTTQNVDSYLEIVRFVKDLWPEVRIIEATHSKDLEGLIDIYVPQLDFMHTDFAYYNAINQAGDGRQAWFYTCLAPKGEYANRFIELPQLRTRYVHWLNAKYDIPGYLHWGLNQWSPDTDPLTGPQTRMNWAGNILPGGDAWIVYPFNGGLASSIRLEAMRDGIVDYELFEMLKQTDPDRAREIIDQVIFSFTRYDNDIPTFRMRRRQLMDALAGF